MSEIKLNDKNFEAEVIKSTVPVLVDFWASWCGPCKMMAPIVEKMAEKFNGAVKVGKYSVEESSEVAGKYGVMSIPTFIIFKDGKIVDQWSGVTPEDDVITKVKKVIGN